MEIKGSDIRKKYGSTEILKDVSVKVKDHQFVGIIGPNGSGKSTFLKCVYRILKPDNGAVYLDGQALLDMSVKESARKIAVVAQHNYYNFDFKIEEVVMMGRSPHKRNMERDNAEDYRIVSDCIEKVGMSRFKGRSFSTLAAVRGFLSFRPDSHIKGVLFNRLSPMLYPALNSSALFWPGPWPSRHPASCWTNRPIIWTSSTSFSCWTL